MRKPTVLNTKIEIWKPVKGFEEIYEVSNLGRVRCISNHVAKYRRGYIKSQCPQSNGKYMTVSLWDREKNMSRPYRVHRLVAEAFIPNPENKEQVNHKDKNTFNNNVDNLEWVTCSENHRHAYNNGRKASNCWNGKKMPKHTSNYHYVLWDKSKKKWMVSMKWKRKNYYVGRYNSEIEAAKAADAFIKANNWDKVLNFS